MQGDDDACSCEDFTEPVSREEVEGWLTVHEENKNRIVTNEYEIAKYDIVFYGDDLVENLNGLSYNEPIKGGTQIAEYFKNQFTYDGPESNVNSLALGITGDSVRGTGWCTNKEKYIRSPPRYSNRIFVVTTDCQSFVASQTRGNARQS